MTTKQDAEAVRKALRVAADAVATARAELDSATVGESVLYGTRSKLCMALGLDPNASGIAIVDAARSVIHERDEARRELAHRPTMIAHTAALRERDEARAEVERLRSTSWPAERRDIAIREAEERGARWAVEAWHRDEIQTGQAREEAERICAEVRKAGGDDQE